MSQKKTLQRPRISGNQVILVGQRWCLPQAPSWTPLLMVLVGERVCNKVAKGSSAPDQYVGRGSGTDSSEDSEEGYPYGRRYPFPGRSKGRRQPRPSSRPSNAEMYGADDFFGQSNAAVMADGDESTREKRGVWCHAVGPYCCECVRHSAKDEGHPGTGSSYFCRHSFFCRCLYQLKKKIIQRGERFVALTFTPMICPPVVLVKLAWAHFIPG